MWIKLILGGAIIRIGTTTEGFIALNKHLSRLDDELWNKRMNVLAEEMKDISKSNSEEWKKLIAVITGKNKEDTFKLKEGDNTEFENFKEAKNKLKIWCLDKSITNRTYGDYNLLGAICRHK